MRKRVVPIIEEELAPNRLTVLEDKPQRWATEGLDSRAVLEPFSTEGGPVADKPVDEIAAYIAPFAKLAEERANLEAAQEQARENEMLAGMTNAYSRLQSVWGAPYDPNAAAMRMTRARRPVADAMQRVEQAEKEQAARRQYGMDLREIERGRELGRLTGHQGDFLKGEDALAMYGQDMTTGRLDKSLASQLEMQSRSQDFTAEQNELNRQNALAVAEMRRKRAGGGGSGGSGVDRRALAQSLAERRFPNDPVRQAAYVEQYVTNESFRNQEGMYEVRETDPRLKHEDAVRYAVKYQEGRTKRSGAMKALNDLVALMGKDGNIPGVGLVEGMVPDEALRLAENAGVGKEYAQQALRIREQRKLAGEAALRAATGAATNPGEVKLYEELAGKIMFGTDREAREAAARLLSLINAADEEAYGALPSESRGYLERNLATRGQRGAARDSGGSPVRERATVERGEPGRTVVKKGYNPNTDQTQIVYSDGSREIVKGRR